MIITEIMMPKATNWRVLSVLRPRPEDAITIVGGCRRCLQEWTFCVGFVDTTDRNLIRDLERVLY